MRLSNSSEHHFLLSSGQSTIKHFKAREAKYGKFAYSSAFGFSVPCGSFLEQIAPDSTLAVSFDNDEESWKVRWDPYDVQSNVLQAGKEVVPTLVSTWRPWKTEDLRLRTSLIPSVKRWPGWHLRIHHVVWKPKAESRGLILVDGGFAASAQTSKNVSIFEQTVRDMSETANAAEGCYKIKSSAIVISESGASGTEDLTARFIQEKVGINLHKIESEATIIRADPNT
jgi:hypothetical protein